MIDTYESEEKTCDGLDNDCNGKVDDNLGTTTCGVGVCEHSVANCENGVEQTCDPMEGMADETCDGLDNNCDGKTDEALGDVTCGKGVCTQTGPACINGKAQSCDPFKGAVAEVCDGIDNDCDGERDKNLGRPTCGLGP